MFSHTVVMVVIGPSLARRGSRPHALLTYAFLVVGRIQLHENQERGALAIFLLDSLVFRMLVPACRNQEMVQQVFASAEKNEGIQKHVSQYFMF